MRFPLLYRPPVKEVRFHMGVGVVDIPDVRGSSAPVVLRQSIRETIGKGRTTVTEYRWMDGELWEPASREAGVMTGIGTIPAPEGDYVIRKPNGVQEACAVNPILPWFQHYSQMLDWLDKYEDSIPYDAGDMSPDLVSSRVWKAVGEMVPDLLLVDGVFHRKSRGPLVTIWQDRADARTVTRSCVLPWTNSDIPTSCTFTIHQEHEIDDVVAGRATDVFRASSIEMVGISSLDEIDTGYDPLPLEVEHLAWNYLGELARRGFGVASQETVACVVALRRALRELHGQELDFSGHNAFRTDPRSPLDKLGPDSLSLMPLIRDLAETARFHSIHSSDLVLSESRARSRMAAPTVHAEDTDALSLAFGGGHAA